MKYLFGLPVLITALLIALAYNAWLQLSIQDKIGVESIKLKEYLIQSAEKSNKMNSQLATIEQLNQNTQSLNERVTGIQTNTLGLEQQLKKLDQVVAAIANRVHNIDKNTALTSQDIAKIQTSLQFSVSKLQAMRSNNLQIVQTLSKMQSIQNEINNNLHEMNDKTKIIPQKGGK